MLVKMWHNAVMTERSITSKKTLALQASLIAAALLLTACGGDDEDSADTTAPATTAVTTTTTAVSEMDRNTLLATARCEDAIPPGRFMKDFIEDGSYDFIDEAKASCDEAKLQLDIEDGTEAAALREKVALANLDLSFLSLATFQPGKDVTELVSKLNATALDIAELLEIRRYELPAEGSIIIP